MGDHSKEEHTMTSSTDSLGKSVLAVAGTVMPSGLGALGLLAKGVDALADALKANDQRRYEAFCRRALEGMVCVENGENLTADELIEMLKACLADIEAEKASVYGQLASAIATNNVLKQLRFPLMTTLAALTLGQIQKLRKAYIAHAYELICPDGMGFRREARLYLIGDTPADSWDVDRLTSLLVVKGHSLTTLGKQLVEACFRNDELQPTSIGERTWNGAVELDVLGFHRPRPRQATLAYGPHPLVAMARDQGRRVNHVELERGAKTNVPNRLGFPCFVLLVDNDTPHILKRRSFVETWIAEGKTPIVASHGQIEAALREAFPSARFIEEESLATLAERTLQTVREIVAETGDAF